MYRISERDFPSLRSKNSQNFLRTRLSITSILKSNQNKSNAVSIFSNLGGGTHGLLGLVVDSATYQSLAEIPFAKPPNPVAVPTIHIGSSDPIIVQIERAHKEVIREW